MKRKILLIDDDPVFRTFIKKILKEPEYSLIEATDGLQAMKEISSHYIDLIICDLVMPELSGYNVIWEIKRNKKYKKIPIMAASGLSGEIVKSRLKEIKANAWIKKPVDPDILMKAISDFFVDSVTN